MLSKIKNLTLILVISVFNLSVLGQTFTYSGPTTVTVNYGNTNAYATFNFSYYNVNNNTTFLPELIIAVDGTVITSGLCDAPGPWLPSSYTITLTPGSHAISFSLMSVDESTKNCYDPVLHQQQQTTVTANFKVRVKNIFEYGKIFVDNLITQKNSPYDRTSYTNNNFQIGAIDQTYSSYNYIWNTSGTNNSTWNRKLENGSENSYSTNRNTTYTVQSNDRNTNLIAGLRKICATTFKNQHSGGEVGGNIIVNGTNYTSPTPSTNVVEQNKITAKTDNHEINGIYFTFNNWSTGSTNPQTDFYPNVHTEYTAVFKGRPTNTYRNQAFNTKVVGQPIVIYWNQHPNSNVTKYSIYRKTKFGTEQLIHTRNRTTASSYSFTDPDYVHTNNTSTNNLLNYDVRAFYGPDGQYSESDWRTLYGELEAKRQEELISEKMEEVNYEYGIENYPNPFNPTSTINYTIKEIGNVNITIYDALGRKVKELLNEIKTPGSYEVKFDGSNLSSGIYIYTMQVNNFFESKKMILTK